MPTGRPIIQNYPQAPVNITYKSIQGKSKLPIQGFMFEQVRIYMW